MKREQLKSCYAVLALEVITRNLMQNEKLSFLVGDNFDETDIIKIHISSLKKPHVLVPIAL